MTVWDCKYEIIWNITSNYPPERNKGVWVSDGWMKILIVCILLYTGISFIHSLL